ncbi:MAG: autotransporter, partial [Treponema sp.]|nr:autotransporter [Treponema sp.]
MKKIVAMGAAVALAASMFAAEPAANAAVTEFTGNASVEWGVNLDTNKTGFKNSTDQHLKFKLFDGGSKSTEGSGVWAELKIKSADDWGPAWKAEDGGCAAMKAVVDTAKIHFDNFYIGILAGDTQTGALKFTRAIKSGDN